MLWKAVFIVAVDDEPSALCVHSERADINFEISRKVPMSGRNLCRHTPTLFMGDDAVATSTMALAVHVNARIPRYAEGSIRTNISNTTLPLFADSN
jgi:hypothetical protein